MVGTVLRVGWAFFLAAALPAVGMAQDGAPPAESVPTQGSAQGPAQGPALPGSEEAGDCLVPGSDGDEIVVCGFWQEGDRFRVQSTRAINPDDEQALRDGLPRAPNVDGPGIFQGPATVGGGCFLQDCPPPPAYMVDFSELPEAPEGSDADRIAKGEIPAP
jgi:hypothetical protein